MTTTSPFNPEYSNAYNHERPVQQISRSKVAALKAIFDNNTELPPPANSPRLNHIVSQPFRAPSATLVRSVRSDSFKDNVDTTNIKAKANGFKPLSSEGSNRSETNHQVDQKSPSKSEAYNALNNESSRAFSKVSNNITMVKGSPKGDVSVEINHSTPSDEGYGPGNFLGEVSANLTPDGPVTVLSVKVIMSDSENNASGKKLITTAFASANKLLSEMFSKNDKLKGIELSSTPNIVRLKHIQNQDANIIIHKHYNAMLELSKQRSEPTISDYKKAFNNTELPPVPKGKDPDFYMENERKTIAETLEYLDEMKNKVLDYNNLDISYPVHPDATKLEEDIMEFVFNELTNLEGSSLTTTAARVASSFENSAVSGLHFNARQDTIDVHVTQNGEPSPVSYYLDEAQYTDYAYEGASKRNKQP